MSRKSQNATRQRIRRALTDPLHDEGDALAAMKVVHAAGPTLSIEHRPSGPLIGRGEGMVAVIGKTGDVKWRRQGQIKGGRPTTLMPIKQDIINAENKFFDEIAALERACREEAAKLGRITSQQQAAWTASVAARQKKKIKIIAELNARKASPSSASAVAKKLKVSPRHVRKARQSVK